MRVLSIGTLRKFWTSSLKYADAERPLRAWFKEVESAAWQTPAEVKEKYRNATILKKSRVVFNIHGNTYRVIVHVDYPRGWMFIKFVGTHEQYDEIDADTI